MKLSSNTRERLKATLVEQISLQISKIVAAQTGIDSVPPEVPKLSQTFLRQNPTLDSAEDRKAKMNSTETVGYMDIDLEDKETKLNRTATVVYISIDLDDEKTKINDPSRLNSSNYRLENVNPHLK